METNSEQATARLVVDVLVGTTPISGVMRADEGIEVEFVGWTALASVIDAAVTARGEAKDDGATAYPS